ncbi:MAG: winged helix-turn-helix domain-containing protein [Bryobacteraceae bacterium]|jgi:DNA-binding winged helix-turn-helix (wHTH) protein/tetratricopeptide (TPR) repeat protein
MEKQTVIFYEFDSFRVDPLNRRLTWQDQVIPLTPLAFNTLLFLIENNARLVTKAELQTAIWPDTFVDDPNLAVMISVVRKALGDSGHAQKYIQTVAKSGYRFTAQVRTLGSSEPERVPDADPHASRERHIPQPAWSALRKSAALAVSLLVIATVWGLAVTSKGRRTLGTRAVFASGPIATKISTVPAVEHSGTRAWDLKGRYSWSRGTENGLKQSIVYFTNAITEDPRDAEAYAGLADAYGSLATWSVQSSEVAYRKARDAAERAVALDDSLSQAHSALGTIAMVHDWNFGQAEREFRRAVELGPRDAIAHNRLGGYLAATGKLQDALREVRIAHELDPLSLDIGVTVGRMLYYARQYDEAMAEYRKIIDLDPHYSVAYYYLGTAYFVQGDFQHAIPELEASSKLVHDREPLALGLYAAARARNGDQAGAQAILAELCERSQMEYVSPVGIAFLYMGLGDELHALDWIEKTFKNHLINAVYAGVDPIYDSLRSNPRFAAQLRLVNIKSTASLPQLLHLASR